MRTTPDLRSSQLVARVGAALVASGLVAGAALAAAGPASALDGFTISGGTWNVRSAVGGSVVGSVSGGTPVGIDCQVIGPAVSVAGFGTSTVYDRLTGRGFVSDLAVRETAYAVRDSRLRDCGALGQPSPQSATPASAAWGRTRPTNSGEAGQCTWYAYDRFKQATGVYPLVYGDAHAWNESAAANGWTVTTTPRARSIVVFEPGIQGALGAGHVAWVESVQQRADDVYISVAEMNVRGKGVISSRTVKHVSGMSYILAP